MIEPTLLKYFIPLLYNPELLLKAHDREMSRIQKLRDDYNRMEKEFEQFKQRAKDLEKEL